MDGDEFMILLQDVRLLGNRALSGGVFQYVRCLLGSPFFSRERVSAYIFKYCTSHSVSLSSAGGWGVSQCSACSPRSGSLAVQ